MGPQSGSLLPGQRTTIDIMFIPNSDKPFSQKLTFRCKDNNKPFIMNVKGQGINYMVDLIPENVKMGPVLPYDKSSIACIEMRNPMEQPIEVYSLDFDKLYLEEEDILKRHDNFAPTNPLQEPMFMPLRAPGTDFWVSLKLIDEKKRRLEDNKKQLKALEDELIAVNHPVKQEDGTEALPEGAAEKI